MKNFTEIDDNKQKIINIFNQNVKGKTYIKTDGHCGSEGHWLEAQMGILHSSKNEPDIFGYEMKKSSPKITFGDFSASEYLFSKNKKYIDNTYSITRDEFIKTFGMPNPNKQNRYSWSGKCVPKYGEWNFCGQILIFNNDLDLCVNYSFEKDTREGKHLYPECIKNNITIAIWKKDKLKTHINKKFNNNGFFICQKNNNNIYENICFGKPFDFDYFVENIKNKSIIFDSGMYEGNTRNYSQFRSPQKNFWNQLIIEEY